MKNKRDKTITKFPLTKPKTYGYRVQKKMITKLKALSL